MNFQSDKTVQRRGWTAAVNIYDCNYPHLEDAHWRRKSKKVQRKKTYKHQQSPTQTATTTLSATSESATPESATPESATPGIVTTTFVETIESTTAPIQITTTLEDSSHSEINTSTPTVFNTEVYETTEFETTEYETSTIYFTNATQTAPTSKNVSSTSAATSLITNTEPLLNQTSNENEENETFEEITDRIDVTLNKIENWSKDLSYFPLEETR